MLKTLVLHAIHSRGYELQPRRKHSPEPQVPPDHVVVPRFLCPSGHKLFDFRTEPGFSEVATTIRHEERTLLDYNRLLTLWQAVRNTRNIHHAVAEVGVYKGGSSKFLAMAFDHFKQSPLIKAFDTFEGHPGDANAQTDGPNVPGWFSDTSFQQVQSYLSGFPNITPIQGDFRDTCSQVSPGTFRLVHIDVDIQASTVFCLDFFWPRLAPNGIMVVDDYGFTTCKGLKGAVDAFIEKTHDCQSFYLHTGQIVLLKS
jgi:O-methyltransferase